MDLLLPMMLADDAAESKLKHCVDRSGKSLNGGNWYLL